MSTFRKIVLLITSIAAVFVLAAFLEVAYAHHGGTHVTGYFKYSIESGPMSQVCVYDTVFGDMAITIRAVEICPLYQEFIL